MWESDNAFYRFFANYRDIIIVSLLWRIAELPVYFCWKMPSRLANTVGTDYPKQAVDAKRLVISSISPHQDPINQWINRKSFAVLGQDANSATLTRRQ